MSLPRSPSAESPRLRRARAPRRTRRRKRRQGALDAARGTGEKETRRSPSSTTPRLCEASLLWRRPSARSEMRGVRLGVGPRAPWCLPGLRSVSPCGHASTLRAPTRHAVHPTGRGQFCQPGHPRNRSVTKRRRPEHRLPARGPVGGSGLFLGCEPDRELGASGIGGRRDLVGRHLSRRATRRTSR